MSKDIVDSSKALRLIARTPVNWYYSMMGKLLLISTQCILVCFGTFANASAIPEVQKSNLSFSAKVVLAVIIAVIGLSALRAYIKSDEQ